MSDVFCKLCGVTDDQQAKCDDFEKVPTWDDLLITTPLCHLCSGRTDCIASAIQPPALSVPPTGTGCVAAA
jgi:hypothetical protein